MLSTLVLDIFATRIAPNMQAVTPKREYHYDHVRICPVFYAVGSFDMCFKIVRSTENPHTAASHVLKSFVCRAPLLVCLHLLSRVFAHEPQLSLGCVLLQLIICI
jgi:hypothetical protein